MADRERTYLIRVSAVLERSTAAAAGDLVQSYERAQRTTERSSRASADRSQKHVSNIRDRYFADQQRQEERAASNKARSEERAQQHVARIKDKFFRDEQRQQERQAAEEERQAVRKAARIARAEAQEARKAENAGKHAFEERKARVRQIAGDSYSNMAAAGSKALAVGGQLAGGMGVNFDVQSGVARAVQLQKMAMGIATSGNRGNMSQGDVITQAKGYEQQARDIGNKYAFDPTKVLGGLAQFQAKTGDMSTASAGLERYAKLAKAFNIDLDDMISAAGEVSSKLEDTFKPGEERAQKTYEVLKTLTSQGQEGSIEIAQLATEMARIGGGAGFFGGDVGTTIAKLGTLAQLARQTGGATSAADAARSVSAFVTTFKTPARRKEFEAAGVALEDEKGFFRDPMQIIKDSIVATGGDADKMNALFKSSLATKSVDTLTKAYKGAGGGEAGLEAIDKIVAKFDRPLTEAGIKANVGANMSTTESKAQLFQNKLDAITASLAERVLPSLERLAPSAERVAKGFADVVSAVADNPGRAITLAIIASIGKATLGPMISKAIVESIAGKTGGGGIGGSGMVGAGLDPTRKVAGMAAGTAGSLLGSATTIGAIAVTSFTVGSMIVDKYMDGEDAVQKKTQEGDLKLMNAEAILRGAAKTGNMSDEDKAAVQKEIWDLKNRIGWAQSESNEMIPGAVGALLRSGENYVTGSGPGYDTMRTAQKDAENLPELQQRLAALQENMNNFGSKTLTIKGVVEVSNMATIISGTGGQAGVPDAPNASFVGG